MKAYFKAVILGTYCYFAMGISDVLAGKASHDTHHAEGGSVGLPQLDVSTYPSQLFWLAVTFIFLYLVFSSRTLPEISNVLENRQEHIKNELYEAEKMKSEAEEVQKQYETNLEKAREEASGSLATMQEELRDKAEASYQKFLKKSEKDIKAKEKELANIKDEAMDEMNNIAAEVASEAAQKIVGINADLEQAKNVVKSLNGKAKAA
jgi:F-type H+-transporting ATPase subunit b